MSKETLKSESESKNVFEKYDDAVQSRSLKKSLD